jgi:hypothetical protein
MKDALRFRFPDGEMASWAVLGDLTDRSVRLWIREPSGSARAVLSVGGEEYAAAEISTEASRDWVGAAVLDVASPRAGAEFIVRVGEQTLTGRLAPSVGAPTAFRFAFGSCHQPFT